MEDDKKLPENYKFQWDVDDEEEVADGNPEVTETVKATEAPEKADTKPVATKEAPESGGNEYDWKQFGSFLGLEIEKNSPEAIKESIESLKRQAYLSTPTKEIQQIEKMLSLPDKEFMKQMSLLNNFTDKEAEEYVAMLEKQGTLFYEVKKTRTALAGRKGEVEQSLINQNKSKAQEEYQSKVNFNKSVLGAVDKTETLFGGGVSKKMKETAKAYLSSENGFFADLRDPEKASQMAMMWANREAIEKMLEGQGQQKGKNQILSQMQRPEFGTPKRTNVKPGSFDPKAFANGIIAKNSLNFKI